MKFETFKYLWRHGISDIAFSFAIERKNVVCISAEGIFGAFDCLFELPLRVVK